MKAGQLYAKQNYPNPFYGETNIEVYVPGEEISVKVFDTTGKILVRESFKTGQGLHTFRFNRITSYNVCYTKLLRLKAVVNLLFLPEN